MIKKCVFFLANFGINKNIRKNTTHAEFMCIHVGSIVLTDISSGRKLWYTQKG